MNEITATPNRIKQIQELIFGEYLDEWESKLKVLYRGLKELDSRTAEQVKQLEEALNIVKAELKEEIEQEKSERVTALQAFQADIIAKVDSLIESRVEKDAIGKLLIQMGERVKNSPLK